MNQIEQLWQKNRTRAFWDRPNLSYDKWLHVMRTHSSPRHKNMATLSFRHMNPRDLTVLLGEPAFVRVWAEIHDLEPFPRQVLLDHEWGRIVTGTDRFGFNPHVLKLRKSHKALFDLVLCHEPMSIYRLASLLQRDYRRVFDGVKKLASLGLFSLVETQVNRRKTNLVSVTNVNDLDAMLQARASART